MRWLAFLALVAMTSVMHASVRTATIDDFIASEITGAATPGVAYAVVEGGEIQAGERGEILSGSGRPISEDTPFVIGSISKSFTAAAVMQLVEAGDVDIDAGISQYLEAFADSPGGSITIRQLLSHTSGYSTFQGNDSPGAGVQDANALQHQAERIVAWKPAHQPGTRWDYSNANYYVLGALVEAVSGRDYASYIEAEILGPAGMAHSFVADGEAHDGIARGHTPWFGGTRAAPERATYRLSGPVGGVIATASDTARYLAIMMNGEDDILSAASKSQMMRPASNAAPFYGFGWYLDADGGTVFHSGLTPGVETLAIMVPSEQKGIVILVNSGSGMGFGENGDLINGISARALGLDEAIDNGRWGRKALFASFALLPLLFVAGIAVAWLRRAGLRAKAGVSGAFSLWFPLLMTLALAWATVILIPLLFGVSMGTLNRFSPDLALVLTATAATGVVWAVFRLAVFYGGKFETN